MAKKNSKSTKFKKYLTTFFVSSGVLFWTLIIGSYFNYINFNVEDLIYLQAENGVSLDTCVDGDTAWFNINSERTKVRFLYVDTPESTNEIEPYGKEASEFTCNLLTNASEIRIEYDGEKIDNYGRTLAWVFVIDEDGNEILVQEELAANGYVEKYYDYGDYKYEARVDSALNDKYSIFEK